MLATQSTDLGFLLAVFDLAFISSLIGLLIILKIEHL
jgi:hypothetical protein